MPSNNSASAAVNVRRLTTPPPSGGFFMATLSSPAPASLHRPGTFHRAKARGAGNTRAPGAVAAARSSAIAPAAEPAAELSASGGSDRAPRHQARPANQATGRSRSPNGHHQGPGPLPGGGAPPAATKPQTASRCRPIPAAGRGARQLEPPRPQQARRQTPRRAGRLRLHPRWGVVGPAGWCRVGLVWPCGGGRGVWG